MSIRIKRAFSPRSRKLSDEQVRAIRDDDRKAWQVAWEFKVDEATVFNVWSGKQKGHVKNADGSDYVPRRRRGSFAERVGELRGENVVVI